MPSDPILEVSVGDFTLKVLSEHPFDYRVGRGGPKRRITYLVEGLGDAPKVCDALVGAGSNYNGTVHTYPSPHRYPGNENLICVEAGLAEHLSGTTATNQLIGAEQVAITADYEAPTWDAFGTDLQEFFAIGEPIPYASLRISDGHQDYVSPNVALAGGGLAKSIKRRLPLVHYYISRTMIPDLAAYDAIVKALVGKLNTTSFCGMPKGTVLFDGLTMDPQQEFDPSGQRVYTFETVCIYRPYDWNKELDTIANTFVFPASTSDYAYGYAELNNLLYYGII